MPCPTTRRFPRSMSEAFPDVRASAIEEPPPRIRWERYADLALALAIGAALAWACVYGWPL